MSTLYFLPWCRLLKSYSAGEFILLPLSRSAPPACDATEMESVLAMLNHFCDLKGQPIHEFTVVHCKDRGVLADLVDEDSAALQEFVAVACFTALAGRDFEHESGNWANSDCFR